MLGNKLCGMPFAFAIIKEEGEVATKSVGNSGDRGNVMEGWETELHGFTDGMERKDDNIWINT